ncbi:hypothetical protein RJ639_008253 [Escallonia herrerae]|uniref:Reverse transcriptase Ty1/copia-type domain-containing protein n=1 Tax=Escallonia herrerae TaxID=1293975 RepID=A0AA89ART9_9ASTE|nr:hypothetical protein RJ639_008253 [Escallonia herrerae]
MKLAFLNGFLDEEVYIEQPEGYVVRGYEDKVLRLKKAMYGLRQVFDDFKKEMAKEFEMTDIDLMSYYLGIERRSTSSKDVFTFAKDVTLFCNSQTSSQQGASSPSLPKWLQSLSLAGVRPCGARSSQKE